MESSPKEEGFPEQGSIIEKCCYDCKTTKTPLWRSGPSGPKSLCNACGIRLRKKKRVSSTDSGSSPENDMKKPDTGSSPENESKKSKIGRKKKKKGIKLNNGMQVNLLGVKRITSARQWGEVERAALLLMALSCGAVFA